MSQRPGGHVSRRDPRELEQRVMLAREELVRRIDAPESFVRHKPKRRSISEVAAETQGGRVKPAAAVRPAPIERELTDAEETGGYYRFLAVQAVIAFGLLAIGQSEMASMVGLLLSMTLLAGWFTV